MTQFLRDMIRIPSESAEEKAVVERVAREMRPRRLRRGEDRRPRQRPRARGHRARRGRHRRTPRHGRRRRPLDLEARPLRGRADGRRRSSARGASDQEAGIAAAVHGARIAKELGPARRRAAVGDRHRDGGGLRRPVLAVHPAGGSAEAGRGRHHRADEPRASTAATAAGWRWRSGRRASRATARRRSAASTPSTRWRRSSPTSSG